MSAELKKFVQGDYMKDGTLMGNSGFFTLAIVLL